VKYKFLISFLFVFLATSVSMAQSTIGAGGLGSEVNASSKTGTGGISINDSVVSPRSVDNHADLHLNWNDVNSRLSWEQIQDWSISDQHEYVDTNSGYKLPKLSDFSSTPIRVEMDLVRFQRFDIKQMDEHVPISADSISMQDVTVKLRRFGDSSLDAFAKKAFNQSADNVASGRANVLYLSDDESEVILTNSEDK